MQEQVYVQGQGSAGAGDARAYLAMVAAVFAAGSAGTSFPTFGCMIAAFLAAGSSSTAASAFAFPFLTLGGMVISAVLAAGSSSTAASAFALPLPNPFGGVAASVCVCRQCFHVYTHTHTHARRSGGRR